MNSFGATQFAGAGFMDRHAEAGQEKGPDSNGTDTMRSLTISQLAKAQQQAQGGADLICDGRNITQVTIVGLLTAKSQAEAFNLMTVYDGTGTIEVKEFKDGESDDIQDQQNVLVENTYVRVYGSFRGDQSDGPPNSLGRITAFSVRPVEDHNEVVHHQLDIIFQYLYLTQSQNMPGAGNMAGGQAGFGGMSMPGGPMAMGAPMGGNVLQPQGGVAISASEVVRSFLKEQRMPVAVPAIVQGLAGQLGPEAVKAAIGELEGNGHVYNAEGDSYAAC